MTEQPWGSLENAGAEPARELRLERRLPTAVTPSSHVLRVAAMFGLGVDQQREMTVVPPVRLTLRPGRIVFITGPSGGGKSTLLNLIADGLGDTPVIRFDRVPEPADVPLVDAFGDLPLEDVLRRLSLAGLNDAFVMLRRPGELSDGQRYRFQLARALLEAERAGAFAVMLADEFGAALDRTTAQVIARNLRRWVSRSRVCLVCATTHDDLLEALQPDTLIEKGLGERIEVASR